MKKISIKLLLGVFFVMLMIGPAISAELNLSSAASLRDAATEMSDYFAKKNPGVSFKRNFGSSGSVAKQIENGAPCDIYLSANLKWMDYLKEKKLIVPDYTCIFAFNEVVFVGKPGLKIKITKIQDIVKLDKIAIGSPKSVPAGDYAAKAIKKAGIEKQLENKLVMAKDVRECLMYADRGEVDGAFVYKTDALLAKDAKILFAVPQDLYPRVTYPAGLTISGSKNAEAMAFFKFLKSDEAKKILVKYGFVVK